MNLSTTSPSIFIYFMCFWLCWVFIAVHRLSLAALSWGYSLLVVHRLSCPAVCEVFPDQGSNLCPSHWQVDSFFIGSFIFSFFHTSFAFIYLFFKILFILIGGELLYSILVIFAIHWYESAMSLHVFPILRQVDS